MIAPTGQIFFPKYKLTPCLNGSVFDCFMVTCMTVGLLLSSKATSANVRCTSGSYASCEGTVNSPHLRKLKKQAAQSKVSLYSVGQNCLHQAHCFKCDGQPTCRGSRLTLLLFYPLQNELKPRGQLLGELFIQTNRDMQITNCREINLNGSMRETFEHQQSFL